MLNQPNFPFLLVSLLLVSEYYLGLRMATEMQVGIHLRFGASFVAMLKGAGNYVFNSWSRKKS